MVLGKVRVWVMLCGILILFREMLVLFVMIVWVEKLICFFIKLFFR